MKWLLFLLTSVFVAGCNSKQEEKPDHIQVLESLEKNQRQKVFEDAMKSAIFKEQQQIKGWIKRQGGNFIETETGVHVLPIETGDTAITFRPGNKIHAYYTLSILAGDTIIDNWSKGEIIAIENDEKESGLHEALKLLHPGSMAVIVIPSYRAHGLVGDDISIPSLSTVIYKIKISEI